MHVFVLFVLALAMVAAGPSTAATTHTDAVLEVASNGGHASVAFSNLADPHAAAAPFAVTMGPEDDAPLEMVGPDGDTRVRLPRNGGTEVQGDLVVNGTVRSPNVDRHGPPC